MSNSVTKKAIILAAGAGNRLYPVTETIPKPLTPVKGESIIERLISNLRKVGIDKIVVVTGYLGEKIQQKLNGTFPELDISFIDNPKHLNTNNIYSLWLAREHFDEDFLLLESDVVFRSSVLDGLVAGPPDTSACLVAPKAIFMDGACVELKGTPLLVTAPKQVPIHQQGPQHFKTVNFYRIAKSFASGWLKDRLQKKVDEDVLSEYYETLFGEAISSGVEDFFASIIPSYDWYEIDNLNDLDIAEYLLKPVEERQTHLERRHGGYWRYPVVDHCLLYNFHYPPKKLLDHLAARLTYLVREYPSAQQPIAEHLSAYYGVPISDLVVGNGVSELIPLVLADIDKPLIIPSPSFNEYEAAIPSHLVRRFELRADDGFQFDADKILGYAKQTGAGHIVLISPNNPTGNSIPTDTLTKILRGARQLDVQVILDESFVDFQGKGRLPSFLANLFDHPNLSILFSLSKSHGIGGIRIGLLASANRDILKKVRGRLPIWNINSFAEEYLRIFAAYRKEYEESCIKVHQETQALYRNLSEIPGVHAYETDANFVFCRISEPYGTARKLITTLLETDGVFLKDCSGKAMEGSGQYLRISSRNEKENQKLCAAIARVMALRAEIPKLKKAI
ncbi:aminotransferase class I/II-fold pyridoxal phosphate-dependent enzyme [Agrobacterium rhizogenes]|nr:aminotransferase class I/II-fold pyridoxal phosphate-dependent enzyme [Rhizobium rhizogenes]NTH53721.1 aminotransferase class I/II-fold pyridoxal phosphate-dependent enzyme [Rhizobium rhizogenes]NTH73305.1 aminotransferase class I/II-fold pyridoxal phosphate-dependent enzyme [Rhizobium rhizogenes]